MTRAATFALLLAAAAQAAAGDLQEGKWEYTTTMKMPGMPAMPQLPPGVQLPAGMSMPAGGGISRTFQHCVTKDALVPKDEKDCTVTKNERKGSTITWAATCNTPSGKADAQGTATYHGNTMEGSMHMTGTTDDGKPFEMTQQMTGRYLGPCAG